MMWLVVAQGNTSLLEIMLPTAGITLILMSVVMWGRKRRQQSRHQNLTPREQLQRMKEEKAVRGDLEQLMVEIEQLAKRMGAQLDAKSMRLERLLREADEKIAAMERASSGGKADRSEEGRPWETSADPWSEPVQSDATPDTERDAQPDSDTADAELATSVYRLADAGLTPLEIARQLNEHQGKIELVLALRE